MTPAQIIAALEALRLRSEACGLLVAWKEGTVLLLGAETDKLDRLEELVAGGGSPVAFFSFAREGGRLNLALEPLAWVKDRAGLEDYLQSVAAWLAASLAADGVVGAPAVN